MVFKTCTKCGENKDLSDFYSQSTGHMGVRASCKICCKKQNNEWQRSNKEKSRNKAARYRERNPLKVKNSVYKYQKSNPVKMKELRDKFKNANPDKIAFYKAKRRSAKLNATPSWANKDAMIVLYTEAAKLTKSGVVTHVDHIVPLQSPLVCGLHCEANLQLLSANDNVSKGNRWWPDMWYDSEIQ
jgi:hypothetical protein